MTLQQTLPLRQVINGDCLEVMQSFPSECVDCTVTDPPYGINYQSNFRDKQFSVISGDNNLDWLRIVPELYRVMKATSSLYVFTSAALIDSIKSEFDRYFTFKNLIVVKKRHISALGDLEGSFANGFEIVLFYVKGNPKFEKVNIKPVCPSHLNDIRSGNHSFIHRPSAFIDWIPSAPFNLDLVHPTQKTVEIISLFIGLSSKEGDVILDPFLGSGTTAVACEKLQRKWIGIEINKDYCEIAKKRLEPWMNQTRLDTIDGKESLTFP